MNNIYLSIIVPFYNVDKHIIRCLDSIYEQDFSLDSYEVICVNDCSPDKCRDIVIEYQKKFTNLILIEHEKNTKVGGARNTGLKAARGEYIWFVDSDDYIKENSLNLLISTCTQNLLDVLAFNIATVTNDGDIIEEEQAFIDTNNPVEGIELLKQTFNIQIINHLGYPVRGIFKRNLLWKNNIVFPENISYGEETTFMVRCILHANRVMSFSDNHYFYRQNPKSVTSKLEVGYKGELLFQSIVNAGNYVIDLIEESRRYDKILSDNIESGMNWFGNRLFVRLLRTSTKELKVFYKATLENKNLVLRIMPYMNRVNRFVLTFPILGFYCIWFLKPIYYLKRR